MPPVGVDSVAWQLVAADTFNIPLRQAYWNYLLVDQGSERGMHNPKYSVDVLIRSKQILTGIMPVTGAGVPGKFEMSQNYPNPFNPSTKFEFSLPKQANVIVKIFDITGREVKTLINERMSAGKYKVDWNSIDNAGNNVSSGVYFYKIVAGSFTETKKMILVK